MHAHAAGPGIDAGRQAVLVGPKRLLAVGAMKVVETNLVGPVPEGPLSVKVRSLAKPVPCTIDGELGDNRIVRVRFSQPEYGVAPGQAAVFYAGERVVGGGWIEDTENA